MPFQTRLTRPLSSSAAALALLLSAITPAAVAQDQNDPPGRVARLSYVSGDVSFAPAGEDQWTEAGPNRPLVTGDSLATGDSSRAELEVGAAALRLNSDTTLNVAALDDHNAQVQLNSGTVEMRVRIFNRGDNYEVDSPSAAFVAGDRTSFRIDLAPDGSSTTVHVFHGWGTVFGQNNASYPLGEGQTVVFTDPSLADLQLIESPSPDDFDNFYGERDQRYDRFAARGYVSPDMIGGADLDDNGTWVDAPEYGHVWYPNTGPDWAPYRDGHWVWVDPYGWTWIDAAPWGFAPFHYGRWAFIEGRWGWTPGPPALRPVYAPALVVFVGGGPGLAAGGGAAVGWFPLGPRDVYCPPYHTSPNYFTNINVTNVHETFVNTTVINNTYNNVRINNVTVINNYQYRNVQQAATVVPHEAFVGARPVAQARVQVDQATFARASITVNSPVAPTHASLVAGTPARGGSRPPPSAAFSHPIIAHRAPPPPPAPFAARQALIAQNHGQPVSPEAMRSLAARQPAAAQAQARFHVNTAPAPISRPAAAPTAARPAEPLHPAKQAPERPTMQPRIEPAPQARPAQTPPRIEATPRTEPQAAPHPVPGPRLEPQAAPHPAPSPRPEQGPHSATNAQPEPAQRPAAAAPPHQNPPPAKPPTPQQEKEKKEREPQH